MSLRRKPRASGGRSKPVRRAPQRDIYATCGDCGKMSFKTRDAAKAYRRRNPDLADLRPYGCPAGTGTFHLGTLSEEIVEGEVSREEAYANGYAGESRARRRVDERSHGRCERCGGAGSDFSHRRTTAVRDAHQWCGCNALKACRTCHAWAHANPAAARAEGFHVTRFADRPSMVPAKRLGQWVILTCSGKVIDLKPGEVIVEHGLPRRVRVER